MKQFKAKMTNGFGEADTISPEAHREWDDAEGKHSAVPIKNMGVSGQAPTVVGKRDAGLNKHEARSVAKGKGDGAGKSPFPSIPGGGPASGPKLYSGN